MAIRTDLAIEQFETVGECDGVETESITLKDIQIDRVHVINPNGAKKLGKPVGNYVTVRFSEFTPDDSASELHSAIKSELLGLLPHHELVLVAGLGNIHITPDALGPKTVEGILASRHISDEMAESAGLRGLKPVAAISPGVLGQTGIEAGEFISAAAEKIKPDVIIVIDALAARDIKRLGCTVQLSDTGICPGSGVGNSRKEINKKTVGVPVISIGIPTVVDIATFAEDLTGGEYKGTDKMFVTPRDIDELIVNASRTVSHAINCALQPNIDSGILLMLNN